jgi:hypothetical protein
MCARCAPEINEAPTHMRSGAHFEFPVSAARCVAASADAIGPNGEAAEPYQIYHKGFRTGPPTYIPCSFACGRFDLRLGDAAADRTTGELQRATHDQSTDRRPANFF